MGNLSCVCCKKGKKTTRKGRATRKTYQSKYFSNQDIGHCVDKTDGELKQAVLGIPKCWNTSRVLGQGSFGSVILAVNIDTSEPIAVKHIPFIGHEPESLSKLVDEVQEEVQVLRQLQHPNIVQYIGSQTDKDSINIFMEYTGSASIATLLKDFGPFEESVIRKYARQVLQGLECLHTHGIIHRDIKGANVLVTNAGVCKLADFGCSKKKEVKEQVSQFASFKGTARWIAPEVMAQAKYGRFADIWSFGCLLAEMVTAKMPWSEYSNPFDVYVAVCESNVMPVLPTLSPELRNLIEQCLCRTPSKRPNVCKLLRHPFLQVRNKPLKKRSSTRAVQERHTKLQEFPRAFSLECDFLNNKGSSDEILLD